MLKLAELIPFYTAAVTIITADVRPPQIPLLMSLLLLYMFYPRHGQIMNLHCEHLFFKQNNTPGQCRAFTLISTTVDDHKLKGSQTADGPLSRYSVSGHVLQSCSRGYDILAGLHVQSGCTYITVITSQVVSCSKRCSVQWQLNGSCCCTRSVGDRFVQFIQYSNWRYNNTRKNNKRGNSHSCQKNPGPEINAKPPSLQLHKVKD